MAIYWLTLGFKGRTFKLCVLNRWDFNFCICSSSLWAGARKVHPMLGEKVTCATISPHLYILSYKKVQRYPSVWQLCSNFRDGQVWLVSFPPHCIHAKNLIVYARWRVLCKEQILLAHNLYETCVCDNCHPQDASSIEPVSIKQARNRESKATAPSELKY